MVKIPLINILKFCPVLFCILFNQSFQTLFMSIFVSCLCITWNKFKFVTYVLFLDFKMSWLQVAWYKAIFCALSWLCDSYGFTAVKVQHWLTTGHELDPFLSEFDTLQSPALFEVRVFLGKLAIVLAVGINRSSHILSKVATLQCKIFHVSSLSVSALQSKKVGQMTGHWYATYFQTVQLSIPGLNFLGLLNTPHINYIKLQESLEN